MKKLIIFGLLAIMMASCELSDKDWNTGVERLQDMGYTEVEKDYLHCDCHMTGQSFRAISPSGKEVKGSICENRGASGIIIVWK